MMNKKDSYKMEYGKERMMIGVLLLVSLIFIYLPSSVIPMKHIAALMIGATAIYLMLS